MYEKVNPIIAITGSTGFVGTYLSKQFHEKGWRVIRISREKLQKSNQALADTINNADVIINLAGAPVLARWSDEYKKTLYDSRIFTTRKLISAMHQMDHKPHTFISTSAIGYYSSEGLHTEEKHTCSTGFLAKLANDWEKEAMQADSLGIRTLIFRFGVVLGKTGGPLQKMLLPFKLGLGGKIGSGMQPFSWIHIDDLTRAYFAAIETTSYSGVYNLTAPNPTTNLGLTKALGKALSRPTFFQIPTSLLKIRFGEGEKILTMGQSVLPQRLLDSGFQFNYTNIQSAIDQCVSS